jgi:hypothetical protein
MCIWCRDIPLGDISDRHCCLAGAYSGFRDLASNIDHLWAAELVGLNDVATWNFFDGLLYGYHGFVEVPDDRSHDEVARDAALWGRFDFLTHWGEQFDGYKAFVMHPPGGDVRILWRGESVPARCVEVSRAGVVAACNGFTRWFEAQERRLHGRR